MKKRLGIFIILAGIFLLGVVCGLDTTNEQKLVYGKVLYISEINFSSSSFYPGESSDLKIKLENIGDFDLKDVIIKLELPSGFYSSVGELNPQKIRLLKAGENQEINFKIVTSATIEPGIYKCPLVLDYVNQIGESLEENNTISFSVDAIPKITTIILSSELTENKNSGKVTFSVINKGLIDVKFLTIILSETEDFKITSSSENYIGDVDSNDYSSADFSIILNENKKEIVLPVIIEYSDANNREYAENLSLILNIPDSGGSGLGTWIFFIILVVIIFFVVKYFRKRRKI